MPIVVDGNRDAKPVLPGRDRGAPDRRRPLGGV